MAKYNDPKVRVASSYKGVKRTMRSPAHPFQLRTRPYALTPTFISPVLPGETLKNMVMMKRVVTKPIKNPLIGWWTEDYIFYVRLRDIEFHLKETHGEWLDEMVTSPTTFDPTPLKAATADPAWYHSAGAIPWVRYATELITEYFFRDEGEDWDVHKVGPYPMVQIGSRNWMDSLTLDEDKRTDRDVDLDADGDGDITAREAMDQMAHYQALRDAGLETLDYEDWIATFGVKVPEREDTSDVQYKPELIRYSREWAYPTNTVEPSTGVPSSAVSWINSVRADKDRMFKEPGFIIGLTVAKPKAYLSDPTGSLAGFMQTLENWLPAISHQEYEKGFLGFGASAGPLKDKVGSPAKAYWVDLRDLLVYGDQFANFALDSTASAVPVIASMGRYTTEAAIDALFTGDEKYIQQDGICNLTIAGRQVDRTRGRNVL